MSLWLAMLGFTVGLNSALSTAPPLFLDQWPPLVCGVGDRSRLEVESNERFLWLFLEESNAYTQLLSLVALSGEELAVGVLTVQPLEPAIAAWLAPHAFITVDERVWPGQGFAYYESGLLAASGRELPSFQQVVIWSGLMERPPSLLKNVGEPLGFEGFAFQRQQLDCGAASLATVLTWKGLTPDSETCFEQLGGQRTNRASLLEIKRFLENHELTGRGFRTSATELQKVELPVLIHVDRSHFAVLAGHSPLGSLVLDPKLGSMWLSPELFSKRWHGVYFQVQPR